MPEARTGSRRFGHRQGSRRPSGPTAPRAVNRYGSSSRCRRCCVPPVYREIRCPAHQTAGGRECLHHASTDMSQAAARPACRGGCSVAMVDSSRHTARFRLLRFCLCSNGFCRARPLTTAHLNKPSTEATVRFQDDAESNEPSGSSQRHSPNPSRSGTMRGSKSPCTIVSRASVSRVGGPELPAVRPRRGRSGRGGCRTRPGTPRHRSAAAPVPPPVPGFRRRRTCRAVRRG